MNRLKQKLKSESGASILLALLFFLICALVAAAVLMAAVSNAGKIKSNQEMHQKYLAVSSALELVCDDLLSAEYCGKYTVGITEHKAKESESDGETGEGAVTYTYNYIQTDGEYNCQLGSMLLSELDGIFAEQMKTDVDNFPEDGKITNIAQVKNFPGTENTTHTLTIKAAETDGVKMQEVKVFVTLDRQSYTINLTARLADDAAYGMTAELTPTSANVPRAEQKTENGTYKTAPMTWKLGWITKASEK